MFLGVRIDPGGLRSTDRRHRAVYPQSLKRPEADRIVDDMSRLAGRDDRRVEADTVLFREGERSDGVFVIKSGEVLLAHSVADGTTWRRTAHAGEMLGVSAVLSGCAHHSNAIALSCCEITFVDCAAFRSLIDASPALWFGVLHQLSRDVNESYSLVRLQRTKSSA